MDTGSAALFAAIANMITSGSAVSVTPGQPPTTTPPPAV
ncbi:hypothetical protein DFR69_112136 [Nocardia neocaledoniensis]|uniref:Uncharacterized protein n=1 Tax=Nocardia neocaledoniensis TaxID=236511 RepID=A0A317N602_9NOCA|nr:hypothetical protein DFR69_112136 [Nocardia neocaledoniensis]